MADSSRVPSYNEIPLDHVMNAALPCNTPNHPVCKPVAMLYLSTSRSSAYELKRFAFVVVTILFQVCPLLLYIFIESVCLKSAALIICEMYEGVCFPHRAYF